MSNSHKYVWSWSLHPPFLHVERMDTKEYVERKPEYEEEYPPEPRHRTASWEGFPSARAWSILEINSRYKILRQLDGGLEHVKVLQQLNESFSKVKDTTNVIVALFAAIGTALIAVPGIETTHWMTRGFFFAAILLAIGGVIIGAMVPRLFNLFFGEDIDVDSRYLKDEENMLTWANHDKLLHGVWEIFAYQTSSITYSAVFLVGGIFAFAITADFSTHTAPAINQPPWPAFALLSLAPFLLYMTTFWRRLWILSRWHRTVREQMPRKPQVLDGIETV